MSATMPATSLLKLKKRRQRRFFFLLYVVTNYHAIELKYFLELIGHESAYFLFFKRRN